jgi:hypothetical protein
MVRLRHFFSARLKKLLFTRISIAPSKVAATLSIFGLLSLTYLSGAAVMFFRLPSHDFLDKAFGGARAWSQRGRSSTAFSPLGGPHEEGVTVDQAEKTCDGLTLVTTTCGARAMLLDMHGTEVHRWEMPFRQAFPQLPHIVNPLPDGMIHWFRAHLYPNGDLLAIYQTDADTPCGYGLVKLDKDSKLLWTYADNVHHDLDVGEDGTIYTLTQKLMTEPSPILESLAVPYLADFLVVLSPEGRELETISILEAFAKSPYALTLSSVSKFSSTVDASGFDTDAWGNATTIPANLKGDLLHTNSVKVLKPSLASKFPLFRSEQLLLSMRHLDTIVVLDRHTRCVTWQAQGIWRMQHDAEFLDNGQLLLYDNSGSRKGTRILEYDPLTQAISWAYLNENSRPFGAAFRGMKQRLPNGNTLIVDPQNRRIFEVTSDKEIVWECYCPLPQFPGVPPDQQPKDLAVTGARRYRADELPFLGGQARPRP